MRILIFSLFFTSFSLSNAQKISLDMNKYKSLIELNKKSQKKSWVGSTNTDINKLNNKIIKEVSRTEFCGYTKNYCDARLLCITEKNKFVDSIKKCKENILIFLLARKVVIRIS